MYKINKIKGTIDLYNKKYIILKKIINIIKKILKLYGYIPIKTPSIENINLLKYKNINNKIIYKIDNNKFLIYDLTIPFIRFLNNNYNKIIFPFKRYQIQKVWRGEKPQLNRYREFYQFDIDIITFKKDNNLFLELELITICENIFNKLNIQVNFNINDINILYGICILLKINKNKWEHFLITIDKINKFNIKKILNILINNNILKKKFKKKFIKLIRYNLLNKNLKKINFLIKIFIKYKITIGLKGVKNIYKLFKYIKKIKFKYLKFKIDYILSRGLNYYNNIIFEIFHNKSNISLLGGGRYDNYLKLKNKNTYYIGMSLGIYRIYNIYKNNFINLKSKNIYLLLINLNLKYFIYYKFIKYMNNYNIIVELFPYHDKIKKQIKYAKKKNINFLIFIGKKEIKNKIIKLKNLKNKKEYIFKNIHNIIIYLNKFL